MSTHKVANRVVKSWILAGATLVMGFTPVLAQARTISGMAGKAQYPADAACFSELGGGIYNTCTTQKKFMIPLDVDNMGNHTITVKAWGYSAANGVACQAWGVDSTTGAATGVPTTGKVSLPAYGSVNYQTITLPNVYVPSGGFMVVYCDVNPSGRVFSFNYLP